MEKTALITGGARGIGFGISTALGAEGWNLAVCGLRDESEVSTLTELKNKIRAFYKRKFKTEKSSTNEIALFAGGKFKGLCRNCGKQGHKSADCRSKGSKADG